jgi:putative ABC transport system substrate-binding protein
MPQVPVIGDVAVLDLDLDRGLHPSRVLFLQRTFHTRINTLALGARLLTIHPNRNSFEGGGFISYGVNYEDLHRRAGDFVDKILRGAKPGNLPVEQPTKFDLAINVTVAKALGFIVPEPILLRADEVIE